jgi:hypothetical protein
MPVYVDRLRDWGWKRGSSCHLIGDTDEELKFFALRLGMRMEWLQVRPIPHFDLTEDRRELAIRIGAVQISYRQLGRMIRARRLNRNA